MPTEFPDLFAALAAPFDSREVKLLTVKGRSMQYVTARTIMNRLDDVVGCECWWDEYEPHENSVLCKLTIGLPDGRVLTKQDAGGYAGMADQGDDEKSGYSDAFKRAAVKFGIGRYLYRDGVPAFVRERCQVPEPNPDHSSPDIDRDRDRQRVNEDFRPSNGHAEQPQQQGGNRNYDGPPRSGKALFAAVKGLEQKHEIDLLKYLNSYAKLQEFPGRMVDFDADQVATVWEEVQRKLQTVHGDSHEG